MKKKCKFSVYSLFLLLILLAADQITKYLAILHLKDQPSVILWKGVFELSYLENRGAAFGVLQGGKIFFLIATIVFLAALLWFFFRIPTSRRFLPLHTICVLIGAGAIGNMIDRILHDYVVDFFYFSLIDFPVFNVADIYVTVSCAMLIIFVLFYYKEKDWEAIFPPRKNKK